MFWTKVFVVTEAGFITGGGGLYGDTAMHSAFTHALFYQGIPPANPLYAGYPLVYPFANDLLSALFLYTGLGLRYSFILPQIAFFIGFIVVTYLTFRKITGNMAVFYAFLIFFLGWGSGFVNYLSDVSITGSFAITKEYTNNSQKLHMHNVLTGLVLPERSFLPGLLMGMILTYLIGTSHSLPSKRSFVIAGILLGTLPVVHTHTFLVFAICVFFWLLPHARELLTTRRMHLASFLAPLAILVVPMIIWIGVHLPYDRFVRFSHGWMNSGVDAPVFWLVNTGFLMPLAVIGVWQLRKYARLFVPIGILFLLANVVVLQPWDWDNIKVITWVFLFLSLPTGLALAWLSRRGFLWTVAGVILLITLTASGALSLAYASGQTFLLYDRLDLELARWVQSNTSVHDVFVIEPIPNHPIPGLAGRSVYLGYPGHLWVHGIDYHAREAQTQRIFAGDVDNLRKTEIPISYIVVNRKAQELFESKLAAPVFTNIKYAVFKVI